MMVMVMVVMMMVIVVMKMAMGIKTGDDAVVQVGVITVFLATSI